MNEEFKKDLAQDILQKIKKQEITMRPRFYFVVIALSLGLGTAAAFLFALLFAIRLTVQFRLFNPHDFLRLGGPGVRPFLTSFPWISLLVAVLGLGLGLWLLHKYKFSYRRKLLPVAAGTVALLIVAGITLGHAAYVAELHEDINVGPFLGRPVMQEKGWVVGVVQEIGEDYFVVLGPRGKEVRVVWHAQTRFEPDQKLMLGERVHVIGSLEEENFSATVIGKDLRQKPLPPRVQGVKRNLK